MNGRPPQIDTTVEIVTPENISFRYRVAGPFRRLPAYLIDLVIRIGLLVGVSMVLVMGFGAVGLQGISRGLIGVLWFLLEWFYMGVLETIFNGQTPGKRMMKIRVVTTDGQPIHAWQAILRNILRVVDAMPLPLYLVGLVTSTLNDRFQRMGDLAAGTMVVIEQTTRLQGVLNFRDTRVAAMAEQIPAHFPVSRSLGLALSLYVQRRKIFSPARRMEIARHLGEPLRLQFGLPDGTDLDLLLCGLYQRTFLGAPLEQRTLEPNAAESKAGIL